jgi:hypothetical protein
MLCNDSRDLRIDPLLEAGLGSKESAKIPICSEACRSKVAGSDESIDSSAMT